MKVEFAERASHCSGEVTIYIGKDKISIPVKEEDTTKTIEDKINNKLKVEYPFRTYSAIVSDDSNN